VASVRPRDEAGVRLAIVSHSVAARVGRGWLTKNRIATIADRLASLGWDVTLLTRVSAGEPFVTRPLVEQVRVQAQEASVRGALAARSTIRQADAVLVFMPTLRTCLLGLIAGRRAVVYWGATWMLREDGTWLRRLLERLLARRAGAVVASGDAVRTALASHRPEVELTVPLVEPEVAHRLHAGSVAEKGGVSGVRALFVGSIAPAKGVPELLQALRDLPDVRCRIVGPVADRALGERARVEAAESANLELLPYLEWDELRACYEWANVLVLPSHTEGLPRVLHEATAFGCALVVTPVGGIPHHLRPEVDALFVPVGDAPALASGLRRLAADASLIPRLARNAADSLGALFPYPDAALQLDSILSRVSGHRATL
jgi:glycosyltransferase involved in cell wall biosynthesis